MDCKCEMAVWEKDDHTTIVFPCDYCAMQEQNIKRMNEATKERLRNEHIKES
jgi:hypothetical protein